jgi:diguanylate cyclase (GGDEF)-like protein/PAS domain S-box-containing protein
VARTTRDHGVLRVLTCIAYGHDRYLLALAVLVCAVACSATVAMRSRRSGYSANRWWLVGAGVCFGSGVWATHFVSMLAFTAPVPIGYDVWHTVISIVFPVIGAACAFVVADDCHWARVPAAGFVIGLSIAGMHYIGMSGMVLAAVVTHDHAMVAAALSLAIALSICALVIDRQSQDTLHRGMTAILLGLAIVTLHFTAMAGTTIVPLMVPGHGSAPADTTYLAIATAAVTTIILILGSGAALLDRRADREADRLRALASSTFEGILIHRAGIILDANDAFCAMVGARLPDIKGTNLVGFFGSDDAQLVRARIDQPTDEALEATLRSADGHSRPVEIFGRPIQASDGPAKVLAIRDLTERRQADERVRHLAHYDALTGLPNRTLLQVRLEHALADCRANQTPVTMLCIDLDRFKTVNDLLGHRSGDLLLVDVAQRLRSCVRTGDIVARLGGDEFAALLTGCGDEETAETIAIRIVDALARPFDLEGQRVTIGASVGAAISPRDGDTPELLPHHADVALYAAKDGGRGRAVMFRTAMGQRVLNRRQLEQDLREAIPRGEFELLYQPVVDVSSALTIGYEALIRWNHPTRGRVSPIDFIPLAEETGLIVPIGQWVLKAACIEAATWPDSLYVAINLSPVQFQQPDFPATVLHALKQSGLPPKRLELEVTEGVLIADADAALRMFREMKSAGVRIALDDFGSGYSSMSYLRHFPFDKIKIDQAFVRGLGNDREAQAIVDAILALAHGLRMQVTAEGVETERQFQELRARGCGQVQGYFFGVPSAADELDFTPLEVPDPTPSESPSPFADEPVAQASLTH